MPNPAVNLLTMLLYMQKKPNRKAGELAEKLGVSVRTVHRYFSMLEEMGIPLYSERGPAGGFSLVAGYSLPPLIFTAEEAGALYLGAAMVEEMWSDIYRQEARSAIIKLENVLPREILGEVEGIKGVYTAKNFHRSDMTSLVPVLKKIRESIKHKKSIRMLYAGREDGKKTRKVDFYAIIHRWGWWYAVGYCHLRTQVRTFRIDRIISADELKEDFTADPDFDLESYLNEEKTKRPVYRCVFGINPGYEKLAETERSVWKSVEKNESGEIRVAFETSDWEWALRTALGYLPGISVIGPEQLKRRFEDTISRSYAYIKGAINEN